MRRLKLFFERAVVKLVLMSVGRRMDKPPFDRPAASGTVRPGELHVQTA